MLEVDGIATRLPFVVQAAGEQLVHVTFELDAAAAGGLARALEEMQSAWRRVMTEFRS